MSVDGLRPPPEIRAGARRAGGMPHRFQEPPPMSAPLQRLCSLLSATAQRRRLATGRTDAPSTENGSRIGGSVALTLKL